MSDAKRVLTVSYGTFSCTLEGFDDSFGTMTAIAAFFRDLAAEDRHFGAVVPPLEAAVPPVGNAFAGEHADVPVTGSGARAAEAEAGASDGRRAEPAAGAPPPARDAVAGSDAAPDTGSDAPDDAAVADAPSEDTRVGDALDLPAAPPAGPAQSVPPQAPAPMMASPVRMSDTLRRLADATTVSRALDAEEADATRQPQRERPRDEDGGPEPGETGAELGGPALPDIDPDATTAPLPSMLPAADGAADAQVQAEGAEDRAETWEPDHGTASGPERDPAQAGVASDHGPGAPGASPFQLLRMPRDGADALDGDPPPQVAAPPADAGGEDVRQADTDDDSAGPPLDLAVAQVLSELDPAEHPDPRQGSDDAEASAADMDAQHDATGLGPERDTDLPDIPEDGLPDGSHADAADARTTPDDPACDTVREDGTGLDPSPADGVDAGDRPERGEGDVQDDVTQAEPEGKDREDSQGEDGDPDEVRVSRLIATANARLAEPGERRRRSAIAHLRAAVAATRAEGGDSPERRARAQEASERPYRADLDALQPSEQPSPGDDADDASHADAGADVGDPAPVTPKRPTPPPSAGARSERPRADAPEATPLVLVSEQRVDAAAEAPVRPRRIRRDEDDAAQGAAPGSVASDPAAHETGTDGAFAAFAQAQGACDLDDLLECAAVYALDRLGQSEVAHPQLWRLVADHLPGWSDLSRETSLRAFGQLQRHGRIRKLRRGAFTVSQASRFRQEARQAAP